MMMLTFIFLLCAIVLSRYQIVNGFKILSGEKYDFTIQATILEHWFNFFTGKANWSDVLYFYPYERTIAQTDAYFLVGIAYLPFRILGFDPFVSSEFAGLVIKAIGFFSMFLLSKKMVGLTFWWSTVAAIVFTLSNGMTIHNQRLQLSTVAFAPLLGFLIWNAIKSFIKGNISQFRKFGILSGVLFGGWCLTCFYMAWFFFFFTVALLFWLYIATESDLVRLLREQVFKSYGSILLIISTTLISLIPFVWAFLPKSLEVGVRSYESVSSNTVPIEGILQTGTDNLLFGRLYAELLSFLSPGYKPHGEYYNTGFSFPIFVLFVFGAIESIKAWRQKKQGALFFAVALATISTWALILNINGKSAWYFVYYLIPGAKALNVVSAYQIFLAFPVVVIAIWFLSTKNIPPQIAGLLVCILFISELNRPYLNFYRDSEVEHLSLIKLPPPDCKSFYVSGWPNQDRILPGFPDWMNNYYAHNVSAMLIAQITRIPTINGMASFVPPDWNFAYPNNADYDKRMQDYAKRHNITNGLCKYNLDKNEWTIIEKPQPLPPLSLGKRMLFNISGSGPDYLVNGWSHPESWGVWSDGQKAMIALPVSLVRPRSILIEAFPLLSSTHTKQNVEILVDGHLAAKLSLTDEGTREFEIQVPESITEDQGLTKPIFLVFILPDAARPKDIGINDDTRKLALGLVALTIR